MMTRRQLLYTATAPFLMGYARPDEDIVGHGDFRYRVHKNWSTRNPFQVAINNCHEMVQDSRGRLIMTQDNPRADIMVWDRSGKLLDAYTNAFPGAHGLTLVDEGGEDFLYVTESGWAADPRTGHNRRQNGYVGKLTLDGRIVFAIGHPMTVGAYTPDMRFQPTETAVAPNGDIYVADGYGSDYILRYDEHGRFIGKFGGRDNDDPNYNLHEAHGIAVDTRDPAGPRLVVTSRQDAAFKYFTLEGEWIKTVPLANLYVCRAVIHGDHLYAGVCWSHSEREGEWWLKHSGFTTVLNGDDRVVSNPGGTAPVYENGILQRARRNDKQTFYHGHDVCVDGDENMFVCQWNAYHTGPVWLERV